jgi:hypothetical protein
MTERQWLACGNPEGMLAFLGGRASESGLRHLACACCRSIWELLTDPRSREAVEVAERFNAGAATAEELRTAHRGATEAADAFARHMNSSRVRRATRAKQSKAYRAWRAASAAAKSAGERWLEEVCRETSNASFRNSTQFDNERRSQAALLREIFGNPFHPVGFEPSWRLWNGGRRSP